MKKINNIHFAKIFNIILWKLNYKQELLEICSPSKETLQNFISEKI